MGGIGLFTPFFNYVSHLPSINLSRLYLEGNYVGELCTGVWSPPTLRLALLFIFSKYAIIPHKLAHTPKYAYLSPINAPDIHGLGAIDVFVLFVTVWSSSRIGLCVRMMKRWAVIRTILNLWPIGLRLGLKSSISSGHLVLHKIS